MATRCHTRDHEMGLSLAPPQYRRVHDEKGNIFFVNWPRGNPGYRGLLKFSWRHRSHVRACGLTYSRRDGATVFVYDPKDGRTQESGATR